MLKVAFSVDKLLLEFFLPRVIGLMARLAGMLPISRKPCAIWGRRRLSRVSAWRIAAAAGRNVAQKHVWRARIVQHSADGIGTNGIMRRTGQSKTCVWRWQERFAQEGYDGLLRDKTRPSRMPPLGPEVAERVVALTLSDPPAEATRWVAAMMAKATGISVSSVQHIWRAHGLRPHRVRQFKLSNDPDFGAKLRDVVGLYVDPPAHAIVLSVDEKSQIQALDRTQPGLPMKKGRLGTMTHDYKRHGTTTLFAALNVLEGKVIGRCMQRHRHQEFIRFLNAIEADIPAGKGVHVILDNYAAHKHAKVRAWLGRHERFTFHFVPTSCSWLNAVEGFFAKLSKRRLKRGVFRSIVDLQVAINRFLDLGEGGGDEGGDDAPALAAGMGQQVAGEVHAAALPCGAEDPGRGGLQALVVVGDHQLHAAQPAPGQRAQELGPEGLGLRRADCHAQDLAAALVVDGHSHGHRDRDDAPGLRAPSHRLRRATDRASRPPAIDRGSR